MHYISRSFGNAYRYCKPTGHGQPLNRIVREEFGLRSTFRRKPGQPASISRSNTHRPSASARWIRSMWPAPLSSRRRSSGPSMSGRRGWPRPLDSTRRPDSLPACSLRRDNPAQRVSLGEHDAAMVDLGLCPRNCFRNAGTHALRQRSATGRAPIACGFFAEHGVALAANSFHSLKFTGSVFAAGNG